jgi:hypothetical protein
MNNFTANYIDAKECNLIKKILDFCIIQIQKTIPEWKEDSKIQILKSINLFTYISE